MKCTLQEAAEEAWSEYQEDDLPISANANRKRILLEERMLDEQMSSRLVVSLLLINGDSLNNPQANRLSFAVQHQPA